MVKQQEGEGIVTKKKKINDDWRKGRRPRQSVVGQLKPSAKAFLSPRQDLLESPPGNLKSSFIF